MERKITETFEFRVADDNEAQALIKRFQEDGSEIISTATKYKEKKSKGEVIDYGVLVTIKLKRGEFWEGL